MCVPKPEPELGNELEALTHSGACFQPSEISTAVVDSKDGHLRFCGSVENAVRKSPEWYSPNIVKNHSVRLRIAKNSR